jgi:hypothetical protein
MTEKKKLDLRRHIPQPAQPAAATLSPTLEDTLAPVLFQPGQVLDPKYMTPFERQQLESIGWGKGMPVPGNAAEVIAAARREAVASSTVLPVPADTPPLQVPKPVDISTLPAAKQKELREALEKAAAFQQQFTAEQIAAGGLPPGVASAIKVADTASRGQPGFAVVDDRPPPDQSAQASAEPSPRPRQAGWPRSDPPGQPKPSGWRKPELQKPPEPEPSMPGPPPIGELSSTGAAGITNCPHCGWELTRHDPTEPDDEDKRAYLMAALAGPGHRFEREGAMLGGFVKVGYRELTGNEADAALTQIADDIRKSRIVGDGEWLQRLMDYRMAQCIGFIDIKNVGRVYEGVDLEDIDSDDDSPTPLPALLGHLLTNVLHSESVRRAVGQGFMRFQRMCEKLSANADEESFWQGIDPQL